MKPKRLVFVLLSIWELIRFILVFIAAEMVFINIIKAQPASIFWLILLSCIQLVIPAASLFLFLNPGRYYSLLHILRLGKILGILPIIGIIIFSLPSFPVNIESNIFNKVKILQILLMAILFLVDLIFLLLLISLKEEEIKSFQGKEDQKQPILPDFSEIQVKDEE